METFEIGWMNKKRQTKKKVEGVIFGMLGVHGVIRDKVKGTYKPQATGTAHFVITHIPTGRKLVMVPRLKNATKVAGYLNMRYNWDFTDLEKYMKKLKINPADMAFNVENALAIVEGKVKER